jgi:hypothetical protein
MSRTTYTAEDLKKLPLRAIVAFAARCARRVEEHAQLSPGDPGRESRRAAINAAITLAEEVANGTASSPTDQVLQAVDVCRELASSGIGCVCAASSAAAAAHTAAIVWITLNSPENDPGTRRWGKTPDARIRQSRLSNLTADLAALDAFTAAVEAADAVGHDDAFIQGAVSDYERLLGLNLGSYPQAGKPVDSSPHGPLGRL